jgi:hypothetical protein
MFMRTMVSPLVDGLPLSSESVWPNKQLAFAIGSKLCTMTFRLLYEALNPLRPGAAAIEIPYWQLPDGSCLTRTRLQGYMQGHLADMSTWAYRPSCDLSQWSASLLFSPAASYEA